MTHGELAEMIMLFKRELAASPDEAAIFRLSLSRGMAQMVLDFLQHMDPDMPPAPICKALGPLVSDVMMNVKLQRLDEIADSLGPQVIRLAMIADQLERRRP